MKAEDLTTPKRVKAVDVSEWMDAGDGTVHWYITDIDAESVLDISGEDDGKNNIEHMLDYCRFGLCDEAGNRLCDDDEKASRLRKLPLSLLRLIATEVMEYNGLTPEVAADEDPAAPGND